MGEIRRRNRSDSAQCEKEMTYCDRIYTTLTGNEKVIRKSIFWRNSIYRTFSTLDLNRDIVLVCFFLLTVLVIMVKVHGIYIGKVQTISKIRIENFTQPFQSPAMLLLIWTATGLSNLSSRKERREHEMTIGQSPSLIPKKKYSNSVLY